MDTKTSCTEDRSQTPDLSKEGSSQSSDWKYPIKKKLAVLQERPLTLSIFKVPNRLRKVDEEAYSPSIVSIGPFHSSTTKKCDHMLAMEEYKWWYMLYFFQRTLKPVELLDQCCEDILTDPEKRVHLCYAEDIKFKPHELAEQMLLDGCFILELFLRVSLEETPAEDPIFQNAWMVPTLQHDLALLENQIPFFILQKLFNIVVMPLRKENRPIASSVTDLAVSFFSPVLNMDQEVIRNICSQLRDSHLHLLDLLHNIFVPPYPKMDPNGKKSFHDELRLPLLFSPPTCDCHGMAGCEIPPQLPPKSKESLGFTECATKLLKAGIEFEEEEKAPLFKIHFDQAKGDIKIPPLHVDETTKSLLRNLIAFEQCHGKTKQHITSYAIVLGSLIQSLPDLELLQKQKIITYNLKEVDDVLIFFKNISRGVVPKNFCLGTLCEDVTAYKKSCRHWHRITASLKVRCQFYWAALLSDYFSTPWSFIAFLAALLLLILTIMQTYYAARS